MSATPPESAPGLVPREVAALLAAQPGPGQEAAWEAFVRRYSHLILTTVRAVSFNYDETMDQYAFVLNGLSQDEHRRLRSFADGNAGAFEAWLVVVARRLCIDYQRKRYGRIRAESDESADRRSGERRRLIDLVTEELDIARTADRSGADPEFEMRQAELHAALQAAIEHLPPRERLLLNLRFEDGRTAREIADAMGFPSPFHVYRRLKKVLGSLRGRLTDRGISDSRP